MCVYATPVNFRFLFIAARRFSLGLPASRCRSSPCARGAQGTPSFLSCLASRLSVNRHPNLIPLPRPYCCLFRDSESMHATQGNSFPPARGFLLLCFWLWVLPRAKPSPQRWPVYDMCIGRGCMHEQIQQIDRYLLPTRFRTVTYSPVIQPPHPFHKKAPQIECMKEEEGSTPAGPQRNAKGCLSLPHLPPSFPPSPFTNSANHTTHTLSL